MELIISSEKYQNLYRIPLSDVRLMLNTIYFDILYINICIFNVYKLLKQVCTPQSLRNLVLITDLNHFSPIPNLTFVVKILEKVVSAQLRSPLEKHNLYEQFQSGFHPLGYIRIYLALSLVPVVSPKVLDFVHFYFSFTRCHWVRSSDVMVSIFIVTLIIFKSILWLNPTQLGVLSLTLRYTLIHILVQL